MYRLTFIESGKIIDITSPNVNSLRSAASYIPTARLWDKKGNLIE